MKKSNNYLNLNQKIISSYSLSQVQDAGSGIISINDLPYLWYIIEIIPFLYKKGRM